MSSFYDDQAMCPKCGMTPIMASDTGPFYLYICTNKECPFETKKHEDLVPVDATAGRRESQPSPPTPRPPVEEFKRYSEDEMTRGYVSKAHNYVISLCNYTLELEKRLKAAEEIQDSWRKGCMGATNKHAIVRSLLADLVEGWKKYNSCWHSMQCPRRNNHQQECNCGYNDFTAALTAGSQYLESGEEGKKK